MRTSRPASVSSRCTSSLRSWSPRRIGVASCTTSTGPGPGARSSRIAGQGQEGVGPDLDPVQLEALEARGLGQRVQLAPQRGHVGRVVAELGDGYGGHGHHLPPQAATRRRLRYISSARSWARRCSAGWTPGNSGR